MKEKTYVISSIKEKVFDDGGSLLNANFKLDDLEKHARNGWVSLTISKRREPSDKGATHYAYVDEFEPKKEPPKEKVESQYSEDLPF